MLGKAVTSLSGSRWLRRIVLPMFERFNPGNIRIRHHYTGQRLVLHSYRHKGYWFHGRRRERSTMQFFQQALREGDTVVEVGGHIGYMTMFFSKLVGRAGRVIVFEPGGNNLPYIRANVAALGNVKIVESAVSDTDGSASFFEEALTGQNNSLLGDYERFETNRQGAFSSEQYKSREVTTVRLDTFAGRHSIRPALMKIDIEGAEFMALTGAARMLEENRPMLLVEVTRCHAEVFRFLIGLGYELFTPEGNPILRADETNENVCALHPRKHGQRMPQWPWARSAAA